MLDGTDIGAGGRYGRSLSSGFASACRQGHGKGAGHAGHEDFSPRPQARSGHKRWLVLHVRQPLTSLVVDAARDDILAHSRDGVSGVSQGAHGAYHDESVDEQSGQMARSEVVAL